MIDRNVVVTFMSSVAGSGINLNESHEHIVNGPGANPPGPLFQRCVALLQDGDPEANTLLPQLEAYPRYAPGWLALGRALLAVKPAAALIAFTRAAAVTRSLSALIGQATALTALTRHAEAAAAYAQAETLAPNDARLPAERGLALRQAGHSEAARNALTRATQLDPTAARHWYSLGILHQDLGEHAHAAQAFRAALQTRPDFPEAAFNLGIALQETGTLDPALDAYAAAWRLRPALLGRIAQALVSPRIGRLWLNPAALEQELAARK